MRKRKLCQASFKWQLECKGPLIICDGRYDKHRENGQGVPNCLFMSHCNDQEIGRIAKQLKTRPPELKFFVPGTSIRGPFRSLAERIIRSLLPQEAVPPFTACDPFEQSKDKTTTACTQQLEKFNEDISRYAAACPACKIFGCGGLASRIFFTDADIADIKDGYHSVYRDMIGIDRFTGGIYQNPENQSWAKMRFHVLENTVFNTMVTIENFELWQLGLMAYIFREFKQEMVPIGFGKTKGFGRVKGTITEICLTYPERYNHIEHIGSLIESERDYYGIEEYNPPQFAHLKPDTGLGLSLYHHLKVTNIPEFLKTVAPAFNEYIETLATKGREADS